MNFVETLKKKSLGFYFALAAAVVALVGLIIYFVYVGKGGELSAWVIIAALLGIACDLSLFFYNGKLAEVPAIAAGVLFTVALGVSLSGGIGNIADAVAEIVMYGDKNLAGLNYTLVVFFGISIIAAVCSCFLAMEKRD